MAKASEKQEQVKSSELVPPKFINVMAVSKGWDGQRRIHPGQHIRMEVALCFKKIKQSKKNEDGRYDWDVIPGIPLGVESLEILPKGAKVEDFLKGKVKSLGVREARLKEKPVYGGARPVVGGHMAPPPPQVLDNPAKEYSEEEMDVI